MSPSLPPLSRFRSSWNMRLRSHFRFQVDGVSITYCYVRKNGCSAFKRLMLDLAGYAGPWNGALDVMRKEFPVFSAREAAAADWRVFVYRDPFSRVASLFRNKMIMQDGANEILKDYEDITGSSACDATFSSFVEAYIAANPRDPHTRHQIDHVLPMEYNAHCTLRSLHGTMTQVLGKECAARYFASRINTSSDHLYEERCDEVPVSELRRRYASSHQLPSESALGSERLRRIVAELYRRDYALDTNGQLRAEPLQMSGSTH